MSYDSSSHRPAQPPPSSLNWLVVILLILGAAFLWRVRAGGNLGGAPSSPLDPKAEPRPVTARGDLAEDEKSTIALFRNASPSVVNITSLAVKRDALRLNVLEIPQGTGSGFLWDNDGHVVTNFHVIESAQAAKVTLEDRSVWNAQLVGVEPDKDIAVLKIDAPKARLRGLLVGSSRDLAVGQKVFAIGNPFGLDQTLTTGVISGVGREIQAASGRPIQGVIQTDAAINPGNSGGPLLDSAGRLIGMNTAIYSPSGASAGIGFAVPVDAINRVVPQIIRHGKVERVGLGITTAEDQIVEKLGLDGVLVLEVRPGSAADKAGLQSTRYDDRDRLVLGDLIVAINGKPLKHSNDLYRLMQEFKAGDEITVTVRRNSQELRLPAVLQVLP